MFDTPAVETLTRALDLISARQTLVGQNIGNIDTPGYRTRDLDFRAELQKVMQAPGQVQTGYRTTDVSGLVERPDGNNVNVDRESLLMAQNQLQFQLATQALRAEFNRLQTAISGGNP